MAATAQRFLPRPSRNPHPWAAPALGAARRAEGSGRAHNGTRCSSLLLFLLPPRPSPGGPQLTARSRGRARYLPQGDPQPRRDPDGIAAAPAAARRAAPRESATRPAPSAPLAEG